MIYLYYGFAYNTNTTTAKIVPLKNKAKAAWMTMIQDLSACVEMNIYQWQIHIVVTLNWLLCLTWLMCDAWLNVSLLFYILIWDVIVSGSASDLVMMMIYSLFLYLDITCNLPFEWGCMCDLYIIWCDHTSSVWPVFNLVGDFNVIWCDHWSSVWLVFITAPSLRRDVIKGWQFSSPPSPVI